MRRPGCRACSTPFVSSGRALLTVGATGPSAAHQRADPRRVVLVSRATASERYATSPSSDVAPRVQRQARPSEPARPSTTVQLSARAKEASANELSTEEQRMVRELQQRDAEVRTHEQAHLAAAGAYARGGPRYDYQQGPDGRRYAVGGEVSIDSAPISGDPAATLAKAAVVKRAALAPQDPSTQDRRVAAAAERMAVEARAELAAQRATVAPEYSDKTAAATTPASRARAAYALHASR